MTRLLATYSPPGDIGLIRVYRLGPGSYSVRCSWKPNGSEYETVSGMDALLTADAIVSASVLDSVVIRCQDQARRTVNRADER